MFYWTSEIAGKVKEILIINPQQCGPEPQIFADGERQGRAGVGKGACFAPGEGERGFFVCAGSVQGALRLAADVSGR